MTYFRKFAAPLTLAFALAAAPEASNAATAAIDVSDMVSTVMPAVVSIGSTLEDPSHPGKKGHAVGSGFIIDGANGYIVTNNHVIDHATEVKVTLQDERILTATVIGADKLTDIAVLKIDAGGPLPSEHFGNSDTMKIGKPVVAIGTPFGLGTSVSSGIVSARGRSLGESPFEDYLQVDSAINPGNSGGPLFDTDGDVIGIDTAIYSPTRSFAGIGFAIPSNQAKFVVDKIIANHGPIHWGYLGATITTTEAAKEAGANLPDGVVVTDVAPNAPAAKAGFQANDVITAVNGHAVKKPGELSRTIASLFAGAVADITYVRKGVTSHVNVTLGERPAPADAAAAQPMPQPKVPPATPALPPGFNKQPAPDAPMAK